MKTIIQRIALVAALMLAQPAIAQIVTVVDAVETSPSSMILPGTTSGMLTFNACTGGCEDDFRRVRLTAETVFTVDGKPVKFSDFRREFANTRQNSDSYALVSYATNTNTVTRIDIIG